MLGLKRIRRKLLLGVAVALCVTTSTGSFQAQEDCDACYNNPDSSAHTFGWVPYPYTSFYADCVALNTCHTNVSQPGACDEYHYKCGSSGEIAAQIQSAVQRNDLAFIVRAQKKYSDHVSMDPASGVVTITDCDDSAIRITIPLKLLARPA